jgi:tRNA(fMet)-specific endonuclease VapC
MNYTLDTNILLYIFKEENFKANIIDKFQLDNPSNKLIVSVVSIGEMRALALKNTWGEKKRDNLEKYLKRFFVLPITNEEITHIYAKIEAFSQNKLPNTPLHTTARNMGKNDIWIAATAALTNSQLLTTDKDFPYLDKAFFDLQLIEAKEWI